MLLEARAFLGYILCQIFVGMLYILLHVDFKCLFLLDIISYVETVIFFVASFLTSGIRVMVLLL